MWCASAGCLVTADPEMGLLGALMAGRMGDWDVGVALVFILFLFCLEFISVHSYFDNKVITCRLKFKFHV